MRLHRDNLPDDPELLKKMLTDLDQQYSTLEEKFKTLQRMLFGRKSEKLTPEDENQMHLFNEAEDGADSDEAEDVEPGKTRIKSYTRKKGGRKPLPEYIPREEIIHDLTEEEKACPCCHKDRPLVGEEATEEFDIIPPKIIVNRHIRKKYGPCSCSDFIHEEIPEIKTAPMPPRLIPHSIASSGLIAYITTSKFCDALPFYRQSKIFKRIDIDLSRATLCNWSMAAAERCRPLMETMIEEIKKSSLLRMDETTLQVLKEPDKPAGSTSYMWIAMGYTAEEKPLLLFQYHPTRSGNVPMNFLENYSGFLQTDGYGGYNKAVRNKDIVHVGCFAHARRYFENAWKLNKKSKTAYKGLEYIKEIYKIESELRSADIEKDKFVEKRKKATVPVLEAFYNWLNVQRDTVIPKSKTGEAIGYTLSEWEKLIRYLDHHLLTPDNNFIENAIRPFVLGRKNWLFSNTPRGAESSAILYSLIESAKANKLEPYKYLRYLFHHLPAAATKNEFRVLLPDKITPEMIEVKEVSEWG